MQDRAGRQLPAWTRSTALAVAGIMVAASAAGVAVATASDASAHGKAAGHGKVLAATARGAKPASKPIVKADVGGKQLASSGIVVNQPATGRLPLPKIKASAYVIADASTGAVLAAKDAHGLLPPASTLKVLTAITMLPRLKPGHFLVATKLAASAQPNIVGLTPGRMYKVSELFDALLLISANDAAVALIQGSGSYGKGLALMNAEAHHLQAYDVIAKTPNGLPAAGQVVSAYDLALIARQALSMPAFMKYDSTLTARFPYKRHKSETLVNQNYLLTQYKGGIGGKIGWTMAAGATYIGLARRDGVTLIVTILHAPSLTEIHSAEKLLSWGFAMDGKVSPVGQLVPPLAAATTTARKGATRPATAAIGGVAGATGYSGTGAGLAAALCVLMLGAVALFRRRVIDARRPQLAPATPGGPATRKASGIPAGPATQEASATQTAPATTDRPAAATNPAAATPITLATGITSATLDTPVTQPTAITEAADPAPGKSYLPD